jgi:hypothetical protein
MNTPPVQTQPALALDPDTLATLLRTTADAMPHHLGTCAEDVARQQRAVFNAITRLGPRDPVEALLASRIVAMHFHIMENLYRAGQPDLLPGLQLRFQAKAHALSKLVDATLFELRDRQTAELVWPGAGSRLRASGLPVSGVPVSGSEPRAQPVPVPTPRPQPAPEAARASAPLLQPPLAEGRHERRRRERAERHAAARASARQPAATVSARQPAAAVALPADVAPAGSTDALHQRLLAGVAARAAASATALAA